MEQSKDTTDVQALQGVMTGAISRRFPNLPEWLESKDTTAGNARVFIDTRTGNEIEIGLCDMSGFLKAITWLEGLEQ